MKNTFVKIIGGTALALLLVGGTQMFGNDQHSEKHQRGIEGVWQVARVGVNCSDPNQALGLPFPAIMTFHRDGIVTGKAKSPVSGPFDTPEYGSWQREPGKQNYSFRELSYRYDGNGTFAGTLVLTANVKLIDANSFIYSATIELANANGDPIDTRCGRATGTRFE
jgi:hypothetical protein